MEFHKNIAINKVSHCERPHLKSLFNLLCFEKYYIFMGFFFRIKFLTLSLSFILFSFCRWAQSNWWTSLKIRLNLFLFYFKRKDLVRYKTQLCWAQRSLSRVSLVWAGNNLEFNSVHHFFFFQLIIKMCSIHLEFRLWIDFF